MCHDSVTNEDESYEAAKILIEPLDFNSLEVEKKNLDSVTLFKRNQAATNGVSDCFQYFDSPISSSTKENSLVSRVLESGTIAHKVTMKH